MRINIDIDNLDNLHDKFKKAPYIAGAETQKALVNGGHILERQAKIKAPVDTGYLRSNIVTQVKTLQVEVISRADYSYHVHERKRRGGKSKKDGYKWMERSAQQVKEKIFAEFQKATENINRSFDF